MRAFVLTQKMKSPARRTSQIYSTLFFGVGESVSRVRRRAWAGENRAAGNACAPRCGLLSLPPRSVAGA